MSVHARLVAVSVVLGLLCCSCKCNSHDAGASGATSSGATATASDASSGWTHALKASLDADPGELYINDMPPTADRPQPRDLKLTLTVANPTRTDYHKDHNDSGVVRYSVRDGENELWHSPEVTTPVITLVDIPAGQSKTFPPATWHTDDVRQYRGKTLKAVGVFVPETLRAEKDVPVKSAE